MNIEIHSNQPVALTVNNNYYGGLNDQKILSELHNIKHILNQIKMTEQEFLDKLTALDDATTAVGTELQLIKDELATAIANGGVNAAFEASIGERLDAATAKLTGLAADPANPVPTA